MKKVIVVNGNIFVYVKKNFFIEKGQKIEITSLHNEDIKDFVTCVVEPSFVDNKLIDSGVIKVNYYVSAVFHKEDTGSNLEDFK